MNGYSVVKEHPVRRQNGEQAGDLSWPSACFLTHSGFFNPLSKIFLETSLLQPQIWRQLEKYILPFPRFADM